MKRKIEESTANNQTAALPVDYLSLGEQLIKEGKYRDALILIKQALQIEPENDRALRTYADILLQFNEPNEALIQIRKAIQIAPENHIGLLIYAQILLELRESHEALIQIEHAIGIANKNNITNIVHLNVYANILNTLNRPNDALIPIEHALCLTSNNVFSFRIHAQILLSLNRLDEAQVAIERALEIAPDNAPNLHWYAKILLNQNRVSEAVIQIEQVLKYTSYNVFNLQLYAEILVKLNRFNEAKSALEKALYMSPHNTYSLRNYAEVLLQVSSSYEALAAIRQALHIEPNNDICLQVYAQILHQLNKPDEALIQIEHALSIAPNNINHLNVYANILNALNRPDDALIPIEHSLLITTNNIFGFLIYAQILSNLNRFKEALVAIEKALGIEPDNAPNLQLYAQILSKSNRLNEAQLAIEKSLAIRPNNHFSLQSHAEILLKLNKLNEALVAIEKALGIAPNHVSSLNIYAEILLESNSFHAAHFTIGRVLNIEPNNASHWCVSAKFFVKLNQLNEALSSIKRALKIAPDNASNLQVYAEILLKLNQLNDAQDVINKSLNTAPDNVLSLNTYAKVLLQLNKLNEAHYVIKRALEVAPDHVPCLNIYAEVLLQLNKLDEALIAIEKSLNLAPDNASSLKIYTAISKKLQEKQDHELCINSTFISKKYFNTQLPSLLSNNSRDNGHQVLRNHTLIKLCTFQQVKDIEQGSSLQELEPVTLNINKSNFTYYSKEPTRPLNSTPCIFIMAGRQDKAAIPTSIPAPNRIILVITEDELNRFYLPHDNEKSPAILLPERTDLLVINHLESQIYGPYDQTALINARRVAALCVAFAFKLNNVMLMDDNIEELNCTNGALTEFNQLWAMHQPYQLLSSIVTSSNRSFHSADNNKLGSKLFLMNAVQLQQAFAFIKPEELAFFLFLPPHCSSLIMEDYYFQLLINRGLHLNNSSLKGHVALDEQTISLTRSSANKSAAKKSTNTFGAFTWLSLTNRTFITDSLAETLSVDNTKPLISRLIDDVVNDIKKIVTNNLRNTNEYLSECKATTLNKVKSGSNKDNKSLDKKQLWMRIKDCPDLNLRQPQKKAIELWINEKNSGYLHSYSIATGVGKTYIKAIMAYLELACTDQPVIVVTADQKLVTNITEKFISVFKQLNTLTQLNLSSNMIIPVMSGGNKAINQGSLAVSEGFKITQNLYVFCEDSFLKLMQEQKVNVNHTALILLDEYHCYTKTLDAAIKAVQGFLVYVGQMEEGSSCYGVDVHQDCISLFDTKGTKHLLDLKPSHIFNSSQIELMKAMVTNKNSLQLSEQTLLKTLQAALQYEQQKMPFPTFHPNDTTDIPFYWGNELPATAIKLVDYLPTEMSNERTTYITPTGIYQTNQTGVTQCVVTQDELMEHWRNNWLVESMDELLKTQDKNQLIQSMLDYVAFNSNDDDFKYDLNRLIMSNEGLPCIDLAEWEPISQQGGFILTNSPPQLIYRNKEGKEQEIASGFDLYQIWGFEPMIERKSYFERIAYHPGLDLNKIAALKQLCANKLLASFPNIIGESSTNIIGFSATPPKQNPLKCVFTYSKETAEHEGYITPSIVRLMEIKDFKSIPYKSIFKDVLTMCGPEGELLYNRKGLYRFQSINELKKAEQILTETYANLSISAVHTSKDKEYTYNEKAILNNFSTIPYNKGAVLLIVSKLQKGWDEPKLSYTVDFKKNPGINSAIQFLGRATRLCNDKNEQQQLIANNKIGLGFFPTSATNLRKHLEPLNIPLPQNKQISLFYSSGKKGCIEEEDYNLNSMQKNQG